MAILMNSSSEADNSTAAYYIGKIKKKCQVGEAFSEDTFTKLVEQTKSSCSNIIFLNNSYNKLTDKARKIEKESLERRAEIQDQLDTEEAALRHLQGKLTLYQDHLTQCRVDPIQPNQIHKKRSDIHQSTRVILEKQIQVTTSSIQSIENKRKRLLTELHNLSLDLADDLRIQAYPLLERASQIEADLTENQRIYVSKLFQSPYDAQFILEAFSDLRRALMKV